MTDVTTHTFWPLKKGIPTEEDLAHLADHIQQDWKRLGAALGLKEKQLKAIEVNNPNDVYERAVAVLQKWKKKIGRKATHHKLAIALNDQLVQRPGLVKGTLSRVDMRISVHSRGLVFTSAAIMESSEATSTFCKCKSACTTKRKDNSNRGCPCKGRNVLCTDQCKCGTTAKPCRNRDSQGQPAASRRVRPRLKGPGFSLTSGAVDVPTEEEERIKENSDVKEFIGTLDEPMVRKLAIRGLRRGLGSMDYIHSLLIMEDDLDEDNFEPPMNQTPLGAEATITATSSITSDPEPSSSTPLVDWCVCCLCRPMPQAVENKCCSQRKCITTTSRFTKLCLDTDVLELCIRNTGDIRNDREDNSTRAFRKAAYRQFILARYGHLGKGNRRVCPSCVVLKIRERFPSVIGVYMGYREH